jgi:hypothetical protein
MNNQLDQLAFSILKKNKLQDCFPDELMDFAKKYPYYPVPRLLLASSLKQTNSADYNQELQKTSLYFNNPLWLDFVLENSDVAEMKSIDEPEFPQVSFEDANNDEMVVENPRPEIFSMKPLNLGIKKESPIAKEPEKTEAELVFEPFHTVDYFASQGIKPSQEVKPEDHLGKQLRSFTEWLKALKKAPVQQLAGSDIIPAEEKIIHLADNSIENRDVDTEAMAEVWIKQGNPEKAMEIYRKLSLLNPPKSSYFAGLIEKLKKN